MEIVEEPQATQADPIPEPEPELQAFDPEPDGADEDLATGAEKPAEIMPLFSHRTEAGPTVEGEETGDLAESAGPVIAPLPSADLTLSEAISRLQPMQVPPAKLAPIHAQLVALRERMGAAG